MATAYYSQPAAANFHAPPIHQHRQRGYRICDQCGAAETPTVRFRLCGGCVRLLPNFNSIIHLTFIISSQLDDDSVLCKLYQLFTSLISNNNLITFIIVTRLPKDTLAIPSYYLPTHGYSDGRRKTTGSLFLWR